MSKIVQVGTNLLVAGAILGMLRGQRKELAEAKRQGLQLAKSGYFSTLDDALAYSEANGGDLHRKYAGQSLLDSLQSGVGVGGVALTKNPIATIAIAGHLIDRGREKNERAETFRQAFESNLPG
ncbi:hypothetical protein [Nodosilinea nodulosa]|uniref:hypothetical protein n=1 Tax=Nodosilinea nodulosa TaxID=416001 RepID=UPI00037C34B1|nr:hypothetical protein [Nodosilinea nodulosa]